MWNFNRMLCGTPTWDGFKLSCSWVWAEFEPELNLSLIIMLAYLCRNNKNKNKNKKNKNKNSLFNVVGYKQKTLATKLLHDS